MQDMTDVEYKDFLLEKPRTATLATVRDDGQPHAAPIWFDLNGDELVFTTWHTTVKAANLRRDPRVAICVDDPTPPFAFVLIEGIASIDTRPKEFLYWTTRIAGRYMGDELAAAYGKRNAVEGEWLVHVKPSKVIAKRGIAD